MKIGDLERGLAVGSKQTGIAMESRVAKVGVVGNLKGTGPKVKGKVCRFGGRIEGGRE